MQVSVVIPTHNRSGLLKRAVQSVLKQTYKELEIIIISDGSTDNTDEVIEDLKEMDPRVRGISYGPAEGANVARNKGIDVATSNYVAFLDDDDEWYPDKIEAQMNIIKKNNQIGLVYTGVNVLYINEKEEYISAGEADGDLSKEIIKRNIIGTTSTALVNKEILKEVGGFDVDLPAAQDYDLWIRVCQKTLVGVVPEPKIYYYNYTDKKQISSNIERYEIARRKINAKYKELFATLTEEEMLTIKTNVAISRANLALRNKQKKIALKYILKSIFLKISKRNLALLVLMPLPYKYILKARKFY